MCPTDSLVWLELFSGRKVTIAVDAPVSPSQQILLLVDELVSSAGSFSGRKVTIAVDAPLSPSQHILLLVEEPKRFLQVGLSYPLVQAPDATT